jgi:site-specific DNA-methyltransferase (adenine-specific)
LAWTSFKKPALCFDYRYYGNLSGKTNMELKIHPTEKPIELYKYCLDKLAKPGDKILDTHLGSGSIAIACAEYGFDLTACELDTEYYNKAIQRIQNHLLQQKLF